MTVLIVVVEEELEIVEVEERMETRIDERYIKARK